MGLGAAVFLGGAAIVAGGAIASGAMQSDATNKANASSTRATNKYMKLAAAESERGFETVLGITKGLRNDQGKLSSTYQKNTTRAVDDYSRTVNNVIGGGKWEKQWVPGKQVTKTVGKGKNKKKVTVDEGGKWEDVYVPEKTYTEGVQEVVDQANKNVADLEERNNEVIEKSADQTYDYNLSRFDDFANFAERMSQRNQEIRLDLARAATPLFDQTRSQMALNDLQLTQGIVPASVKAEIERSSAQRALGSGVGLGGDLRNNLSMRDLGLSSYAGIQQGQKNFQDRQLLDYNTLVAGTQMGVNDVYNFMGLNVNKVIDVNNENSARLFEAQKVPLNYTMVGLNTTLDKRFDAATNRASFLNTMNSNIYGQESTTAREAAGLDAGAAVARTNQKLGIQGQGLTNAYNNANRSLASGLANAQLVSNASSQIGGGMMGAAAGGMGGGGAGSFLGSIGGTSPGGAYNPYAQVRPATAA